MSEALSVALMFCGMGVIILLIGVVFLIFYKKKRKRCSETVVATIVNIASQKGRSMSETARNVNYHYGIYEYQFNGVTYHNSSMVGTTANPKLGKERVLFVNPDDPNDIMEKRFAIMLPMVICFAVGLFWSLLGILIGVCAG